MWYVMQSYLKVLAYK